ncbi:MAG: IS630 family transposase [Pseudomonadota bacterium]|nr:IS630 family transposase [Pseudomonadota bacterium]
MVTLSFSEAIMASLERERAKACELNNLRLYKIAQGLLWVGEGKTLGEIARLLGVSARTVWNWLKRLMVQGLGWLVGQHYRGRGRKAKLNGAQQQALYELVVAGPLANGFDCGVWTTAMLVELIWRRWGVCYNPRYLSSLLAKLGLSYQKARFVSDRQGGPAHEQARRVWVEETWPAILKQAQAQGAVILFADEVSFALWGSLSRTWAPRGQQPVVKTAGRRKGMKLFGAIEFFSGAFYYREAVGYTLNAMVLKQLKAEGVPAEMVHMLGVLKGQRFETEGAFLQAVENHLGAEVVGQYRALLLKLAEGAGKFNAATYEGSLRQLLERITAPIILIEDGASYHRSQAVEQFRQTHAERLTVHRLPAFSPQFNPIEKWWKNTKKAATHLKYFKAFDELRASVLNAFRKYLENATRVICVMKKLHAQAGLA